VVELASANLPDLAELIEPLLIARQVILDQFAILRAAGDTDRPF
jgi:hypothetical protein